MLTRNEVDELIREWQSVRETMQPTSRACEMCKSVRTPEQPGDDVRCYCMADE